MCLLNSSGCLSRWSLSSRCGQLLEGLEKSVRLSDEWAMMDLTGGQKGLCSFRSWSCVFSFHSITLQEVNIGNYSDFTARSSHIFFPKQQWAQNVVSYFCLTSVWFVWVISAAHCSWKKQKKEKGLWLISLGTVSWKKSASEIHIFGLRDLHLSTLSGLPLTPRRGVDGKRKKKKKSEVFSPL